MDINFCPKCGGIDLEKAYGKDGYEGFVGVSGINMQRFRCKKCGNIGIFPVINSKEYPDFIKEFKK